MASRPVVTITDTRTAGVDDQWLLMVVRMLTVLDTLSAFSPSSPSSQMSQRGGSGRSRGGGQQSSPYRGGGRGGGSPSTRGGFKTERGGFGSPQFGSPQPHPRGGGAGRGRGGQHNNNGFGSPIAHKLSDFAVSTPPQRSASAGGARANQPQFGSGGRGRYGTPNKPGFHGGSPGYANSGTPASLIPLGAFSVDERAFRGSVALSLKLGGQGFEDSHVDAVILPWMREQFEPYLSRVYGGYKREEIQLNVELQDNYLTGEGVGFLMNYFSTVITSPGRPYRLTALKFWNNQITDSGAELIASFLTLLARVDVPLLELHLSHNLISEKGAAAIMTAVHEYSRPDTTCTKLLPSAVNESTNPTRSASSPLPAPASSSSVSVLPLTPSPFLLPSSCLDTGIPISPPVHPLWLRLEWNQIVFPLFQSYFNWIHLEPSGLRRAAKQARRRAEKEQLERTASGETPQSLTRQTSQQSTDVEDQPHEDHDDAQHDDGDGGYEDDRVNVSGHNLDESGLMEQLDQTDDEEDDGEEHKENAAESKDRKEHDDELPALENLSISKSSSSATAAASSPSPPPSSSLSFPLPPASLRICPASNRQLCSVRCCKFPPGTGVHLHVCFFQLQHQSYETSDLLDVLKKQKQARACRKTEKAAPLSERQQQETLVKATEAETTPTAASAEPSPSFASLPSPTSLPFTVTADSTSASASSAGAARPLVLFLDTNSVFGMISARQEVRRFDWNQLYSLAEKGKFGAGFKEPERRVYLILCSAVLNEMDARKEYSKKVESGTFASEKFSHLSTLARQIKHQFQTSIADQSAGFLAKCKNLGGVSQGFVKTISVAQGEMNIHPSMLPKATDTRNTSNDRRILNAALHWTQTVGETGVVLLLTDDRNLQALAGVEGVPVVSLYALDRALCQTKYNDSCIDSILLREAIASCSHDLQSSLSNNNIQAPPRADKSVYECLQEAVKAMTQILESGEIPAGSDLEEAREKVDSWRGVLANAPQLLTSLRRAVASPEK
jgi:hypothetical protein